ncbi:lysis system o-spanin lipoprotein Rz1 [Methylophaga sulfidovorans]
MQPVQPIAIDCPKPAPAPAWIMETPPDLQKMLNAIITPSEME